VPFFAGPVSLVLLGAVLIVAVVLWLLRDRRYPGLRLDGEVPVDRDELEAAEREVRELEAGTKPDDERWGDDWGPGTGRPRPPTRL
jgi:hypothetical protein